MFLNDSIAKYRLTKVEDIPFTSKIPLETDFSGPDFNADSALQRHGI